MNRPDDALAGRSIRSGGVRPSCYARQVAREVFLAVLALLTLVAGVALVIVVARRRRQEAAPPAGAGPARVGERSRYGLARASRERRIDDFATPTAFDDSPKLAREVEEDIGKICPRCGARYGSHHRFCEHDNSELAALN